MIAEDEKSFTFIPENTNLDLKNILEVCEKDTEEEALNSKELLVTAEENLKDTITALLFPIIEEQISGFDQLIHKIPGLINNDFNYCSISKEITEMISYQINDYQKTYNEEKNIQRRCKHYYKG